MKRALLILALAGALAGCGDSKADLTLCTSAADHAVSLELDAEVERQVLELPEGDRDGMRPLLRKALSERAESAEKSAQTRAAFVARCEGKAPVAMIECVIAATSAAEYRACLVQPPPE